MIWLLIVVTLLSMVACYFVSGSRSADRRFWVLMALLFGPLAIPFAFFARPAGNSKEDPPA